MKVVVTGGGTGGHLYPALSLAKEITNQFENVEIIYIGGKNSIEAEIVKSKTDYKFIEVEIEGMKSIKKMHENARVYSKFKKAKKEVRKILENLDVDFVIGTGGYVCAPVFSAAKKLNIPYYIHEQNSVFGKVVKYYMRKSNATFVSFPNIKVDKNLDNVIFAGNPQTKVASTMFKTSSAPKNQIVIFSGSLGGKYFNEKITSLYHEFSLLDTNIIHIVGKNYEAKETKYANIKQLQFSNNLMSLLNDSKFVICRAGASTIAELIGLEKPAILVPSPFVAHNHQHKNAAFMTDSNCALKIEEEHIESYLVKDIKFYLDEQNLKKATENFKDVETKDTLNIIINKIKKDLKSKK